MKYLVITIIIVCLIFGGVSQAAAAEKPSGKALVQLHTFQAEIGSKDFRPFDRQGTTPNLFLLIFHNCDELIFASPKTSSFTFKWTLSLSQSPTLTFQEGDCLDIWLVHSPLPGQHDVLAFWRLFSLVEFIELTTPNGTSLNIDAVIVSLPETQRKEQRR